MSRPRRGATALSGILVIDKPAGITSHDVVALLRRSTGERRIGHAGTLDPAATGVLVVLVGSATRLTPALTDAAKSYVARITFGARTDTDDAEGEIVEVLPVPSALRDKEYAGGVIAGLLGSHDQVPPAYSAIKQAGVSAHRAARAGNPLALASRHIEILDAGLLGIVSDPDVSWDVSFTVSKGTYIRAIARDLGTALGTAAHLSALRRISSGRLSLANAHPLDKVTDAGRGCARFFADPVEALGLPFRALTPHEAERVRVGAPLASNEVLESGCEVLLAMADDDRLYALYALGPDGRTLRAHTVLAGGVKR
ncbi:MAG: tRNA pseudouridine(55) synthase TruB [Anaerosomatales bacterium]|nr:tRNA pseudouridine(55) synthase TruB [Anaerosomatales bacterium]MDT8433376.1 tRNA pseudouridine(55) synthase TruB [Anaerosomatales bacterium]